MCEKAFVFSKMQLDQQLSKGDTNDHVFVSQFYNVERNILLPNYILNELTTLHYKLAITASQ